MNAHTDAVHLGAYYENVIYHLLILYIIEHKYVIYSLNKHGCIVPSKKAGMYLVRLGKFICKTLEFYYSRQNKQYNFKPT